MERPRGQSRGGAGRQRSLLFRFFRAVCGVDPMHLFLLSLFGGHGKGDPVWAYQGLGTVSSTQSPRLPLPGDGGARRADVGATLRPRAREQTPKTRSLRPGLARLRRNPGLTVRLMGSSDKSEFYPVYAARLRPLEPWTYMCGLLGFQLLKDGCCARFPLPRSSHR